MNGPALCGVGSASLRVLGPIRAREIFLSCFRQQLSGELKRSVFLFVQVVAHLGRKLAGEFIELWGDGIDTSELLDQLLRLVVIRQRVPADIQPGVDHKQRNVKVSLLGGRVGIKLIGEREEGGAAVFG